MYMYIHVQIQLWGTNPMSTWVYLGSVLVLVLCTISSMLSEVGLLFRVGSQILVIAEDRRIDLLDTSCPKIWHDMMYVLSWLYVIYGCQSSLLDQSFFLKTSYFKYQCDVITMCTYITFYVAIATLWLRYIQVNKYINVTRRYVSYIGNYTKTWRRLASRLGDVGCESDL